ncbi:hypothetical protein DFH07DRAFT_906551 [Mycena maculata]|uniref:Helitron helicase-like domain-containing protein n=1 Tax=Mycena maculata TaxID=230809 RepID=A0AAD7MPF8_9AGAR|nr:hypothetical protein DFH07DRAFT_906551 [Mycena maculata]
MDVSCSKCGALHWKCEQLSTSTIARPLFGACCLSGKVELSAIRKPPRELLELYNGTSHESKHFLDNIRSYNSAFGLASLGVTVDKTVQDGHGPYVFKIQGALYHHVGSLLPKPATNPVYAQLYFYSSGEATNFRMQNNQGRGLRPTVMGILDQVLQQNHAYVQVFRTAYERLKEQREQHPNVQSEFFAVIQCEKGTDARRYNAPTADEVSVILPGDGSIAPDYRDLVLQYKDGPLKWIYETNASYQPSVYVLLFPYGENGWHTNMALNLPVTGADEEDPDDDGSGGGSRTRTKISILDYYAYRLHQCADDSDHIFQARALLQQWIVDGWAATDQRNLNWLKNNQKKLRIDLYK